MTDKIVTTTVEILGKPYSIKCIESEQKSLEEAAAYLNSQMKEVQESGKAINLERIAIITGLNITYDYLQTKQNKNNLVNKINHRIEQLQHKLDSAINSSFQTELIYGID